MKFILSILLVISLSGCASIKNAFDSYFIAKYDSNEHVLINKISVYSTLSKPLCSNTEQMKSSVVSLFGYSSELKNFSQHLPNNLNTSKLNDNLHIMVEELYTRYQTNKDVNKTYCELKLQSISDSANMIQKLLARRPR